MDVSPALPGDEVTVRQLVSLRLMLEDATVRAHSAGRYTRGRAVVALDATIERAVYLVALERNLTVGPKALLPDLHSQLSNSLSSTWRPQRNWTLIRQLHDARNGVQHRNLEPDRDDLPAWVQATEAYVVSLIEAAYGVDVRKITLADAIVDTERSDLIRQATEALNHGDVNTSVKCARAAYHNAVTRWMRMQGRSYRPPPPAYVSGVGRGGGPDGQDKEIEDLGRSAAESTFAPSRAEHEWCQSALREPVEILDADDAERILNFAFSWIAAFEVAERGWVSDRRHRADVAARSVRAGSGPARIAEVDRVRTGGSWGSQVYFKLADVPREEEYDAWADSLRRLLSAPPNSKGSRWGVAQDGTVFLWANPPTGHDVEALADALTRVATDQAAAAAGKARQAQALADEATEHDKELDGIRDQLPSWITSIEWAPGRGRQGSGWQLTIDPVVASVGALLRVSEPRRDLATMVRDQEQVSQCYWNEQNAGFYVQPALPADELLVVLMAADEELRAASHVEQAIRDERRQATADLHAEMTRALMNVQITSATN